MMGGVPAVATALLLLSPAIDAEPKAPPPPVALQDIESWTCSDSIQIDQHYRASLDTVVPNPAASNFVEGPQAAVHRTHFYVYWQEKPNYIAQSVVAFGPLRLDDGALPLPKSVSFALAGGRLTHGEFIFRGGRGGIISLDAMSPAVDWLAPTFRHHWITITDADQLQRLRSEDGWQVHSDDGDPRGPVRLAPNAAIDAAYATLRPRMLAKLAQAASECRANPIDYDAMMESVI